mgnify:CR=1 FL=1
MLLGTTSLIHAQDPLDSLEIYDPFIQINELRRIVTARFTMLGQKSQEEVASLNKETEKLSKTDPTAAGHSTMKAGDIYFRSGIYNLALESYFKALDFFEKGGAMPLVALTHT